MPTYEASVSTSTELLPMAARSAVEITIPATAVAAIWIQCSGLGAFKHFNSKLAIEPSETFTAGRGFRLAPGETARITGRLVSNRILAISDDGSSVTATVIEYHNDIEISNTRVAIDGGGEGGGTPTVQRVDRGTSLPAVGGTSIYLYILTAQDGVDGPGGYLNRGAYWEGPLLVNT